jgi:NADH dehydrogenase [ubiquinone] 1 alpha subcomplex assembly factor 1
MTPSWVGDLLEQQVMTRMPCSLQGMYLIENNGGFASVRSDYGKLDLSGFKKVTVRYRCEGQSLSLNFNYYQRWWYPNYKAVLPETNMEWQTVSVELNELKEYRVGQATGRKISKEKLSDIIRLGIMTNDKKEGPFQAEIDYIEFQ